MLQNVRAIGGSSALGPRCTAVPRSVRLRMRVRRPAHRRCNTHPLALPWRKSRPSLTKTRPRQMQRSWRSKNNADKNQSNQSIDQIKQARAIAWLSSSIKQSIKDIDGKVWSKTTRFLPKPYQIDAGLPIVFLQISRACPSNAFTAQK